MKLSQVVVPQIIQLRRDPKGIEKPMRPNIKKMDLHDNSGTELQNKIRELIDENSRYKQILENVRYFY